jgi:hypothetical protein
MKESCGGDDSPLDGKMPFNKHDRPQSKAGTTAAFNLFLYVVIVRKQL